MEVKCPRCGKPALFNSQNQFRPFCSERCKLIDLGQWAEGKYAVPVSSPPEADIEQAMSELEETNEEPGSDDESDAQSRSLVH
jgi:endogenous inhibitor of DNA gyrase (YacG/DUF329 family)